MGVRGTVMNATVRLVVETCYSCGVAFAMDEDFRDHRLADKNLFYCPAGHAQSYVGKTDAQKAREAEEKATRLQARLDQERANTAMVERKLSAARGQQTKLKKRIQNGTCPCCNRHFANVERHMTTQHPQYSVQPEGAVT